jgi:ribonuclease D
MELAAWRETVAQDENLPRGRVLKDEAIYEIAKHAPRSSEALWRLRAGRDIAKLRGQGILRAVEAGLARDPKEIDAVVSHVDVPASVSATVDLLRVLLKSVAATLDVAPKLIASSDDLERLAQADDAAIPALFGWRRQLFGEKALALKHGKLALSIKNKEIALIDL